MFNTNDYIIRDSSVYANSDAHSLVQSSDPSLKIGVVRDVVELTGPDIAYIVEVWVGGKYTPVQCTRAARFGGVYNYEEVTHRGFTPDETIGSDGLFDFKQGDIVLIAYINGISGEGIIINAINHPGRPRLFTPDDGVVFESEFNGVNKSINSDGEYTTTFKGIQTNIAILDEPATGDIIAPPEYDTAIGSTYTKFDKTGGWEVSDNSESDLQSIKIDKASGMIIITSGSSTLTIDKAAGSYTFDNKETTFNTADKFSIMTKEVSIEATDVKIDATDIESKGKWKQDGKVKIKGDVKITGKLKQTGDVKVLGKTDITGAVKVTGATSLTGGLAVTGPVALAGGANPLVYDIALIIGTGNLGAPVVSSAILLKTALTKAT